MMTTDDKLKTLAKWSRQYKAGIRELVDSGKVDADELVEAAELELDEVDEVQVKRRNVRKLARTF